MTMHGPHFIGVFDGVSGVQDLGLKAEDLSWSLREYLRTNIRIHLSTESKARYDSSVLNFLQEPSWSVTNKPRPGEWLRNLMGYSLAQYSAFGATTGAVAVVIGEKMSWYNIGMRGFG